MDRKPADKSPLDELRARRLGQARAETTTMHASSVVRTRLLDHGGPLPLVIEAGVERADLAAWAQANRATIQEQLSKHGAILFRRFPLRDQRDFERVLDAIALERLHYHEGATPRTSLGRQVYTSTEYPADQSIALHNELSYVTTWPMRACFFCVTAAERGGQTPIADVRRVHDRIPAEIRASFVTEGWLLVRNFRPGISLSWQNTYGTEDKGKLAEYLSAARIDHEWLSDDHLQTRQLRPAVTVHPHTGEEVWFNHMAFWHPSSLDPKVREVLASAYGEDGMPYNTYYGDGSAIPDATVAEVRRAYDTETVDIPWQRGDFLLMDNMLVAHGRRPYGGERRIIVALGDACHRVGLEPRCVVAAAANQESP